MLNSLLTLTRTNNKIITIEEVQEINLAHQGWTALVS
jgi:type IV secretory pathway ATPase VirB11/archaellum biosynthesis ATPase